MPPDQITAKAVLPLSPTANGSAVSQYQPHELNPDLAAAKMANDLVNRMGSPSVLTTPFVVRYGIFSGLNHRDVVNVTGYDCSMRLAVYRMVAKESVNVNGMYFEKVWQYLMRPKVIVQGITGSVAKFHTQQMLEYGTKIVAGVTTLIFARTTRTKPPFFYVTAN